LNRFTFGPRPGDLDTVRAMGIDKWFARQLHPETIDNTELEARLAQFPAMQWSTRDLLYRLPSNAVLRQAAQGKAPIPEAGALHAIYVNEIARYEDRQKQKEQKKQQESKLASGQTMASSDAKMDSARGQRRTRRPAPDPRHLLQRPAPGSDDRLLAQSLQRLSSQERRNPYYLVSYERDVIRPRALGKFEDLLEATAHSPAMLLYLDNSSSMGPDSPPPSAQNRRARRNPNAKKKAPEGLNENYARELMELHTWA
jgi:uncharacterized protein (DUF1800 family)